MKRKLVSRRLSGAEDVVKKGARARLTINRKRVNTTGHNSNQVAIGNNIPPFIQLSDNFKIYWSTKKVTASYLKVYPLLIEELHFLLTFI